MIINSLLGINVFENSLNEEVCSEIKSKVQQYINTNKVTVDGDQLKLVRTTYSENSNFIEEINSLELHNFIIESCEYFLIQLGVNFEYKIHSWLNVYDNKMQMQPHCHYNSLISGCYYVSIPNDSCGEFYIPEHIEQREQYRAINGMKLENISYMPKEGTILLFEPWMKHGVLANTTTEPRISIAFNAFRT